MSASVRNPPQSFGTPNNAVPAIVVPYLIFWAALLSLAFVMFGWDVAFVPG